MPSSSQAPSVSQWTPQIRPTHIASPILEETTKSVSPAGPFMAWNVFTLPDAGTEVISSGMQPMMPVEHQQRMQDNSGDGGCSWQLTNISSSTADDMESSRAVAALLETEMRPDSASASSRLPASSVGDMVSMGESTEQCPLPTYEPLSDDES